MYKSRARHTPAKRHGRRQSTILGLSGVLTLALVGCLTPDGTTSGTDASSYTAHSLAIAADSDWNLSSGSDTPISVASAESSGNVGLTHAEGMGMLEGARPVSTALVELRAATLELASIGIAQRPPHPPMGMGASRDADDRDRHPPMHPDMPGIAGEPNAMMHDPSNEPPQNPDRRDPPPMLPDNFVAVVDGPITLDLLDGASTSAIQDIALTDNTDYVAFLFPITAPDTAALHAEGYFENDNTAFTFVLDIPLRHPLVVPLFSGESAQALTAHVRLAAALSHVDLGRCAAVARQTADGAFAITDPTACLLADAIDRLSQPRSPRHDPEFMGPKPTIVCAGTAAWCAALPADGTLPPRQDLCVTSITRTAAAITITVQEPSASCDSLAPPEHPHRH